MNPTPICIMAPKYFKFAAFSKGILTKFNYLLYLIRSSYTLRCRGFFSSFFGHLQMVGLLGRVSDRCKVST
jgi:hypothetical protein